MARAEHELLNALYDDERRGKGAAESGWPAGDPRHEQLAGLREVREALGAAAASMPGPPSRLHGMLMTEASLELRLRETEDLADEIFERDGTRRTKQAGVAGPTPAAKPATPRQWWQRVSPGQWVSLASAAMLLVAVSIVVRGSGMSSPESAAADRMTASDSARNSAGLITAATSRSPEVGVTSTSTNGNSGWANRPSANNSAGSGNDSTTQTPDPVEPSGTTQPQTVTVDSLELRIGQRLPRLDLGQWTTKGGYVDLDRALDDTAGELKSPAIAASPKAVRQRLQIVWSVYTDAKAGEEQRLQALGLIADHGVRADDAELTELARTADELLYKQFRPAWYTRHENRPQEAPDTGQQRDSKEPPREQQKQQLDPPDDGRKNQQQEQQRQRDGEDGG